MPKQQTEKWYNQRTWAAVIAAASLLAAYGLGSRALFTGSLQQYALTIAVIVLAINRLAHLVIISVRKTAR
jgi:membrane protein YdbS with pleckstrin-like domain